MGGPGHNAAGSGDGGARPVAVLPAPAEPDVRNRAELRVERRAVRNGRAGSVQCYMVHLQSVVP